MKMSDNQQIDLGRIFKLRLDGQGGCRNRCGVFRRELLDPQKGVPQPALLGRDGMSIQGNISPVRSLVELTQVAMGNGTKCALIPIENKRQFLEVNPDVLEKGDPIFCGDIQNATSKTLMLD